MSIDPGLIRAEAHIEVGQLIQRDASILLERWSRRAVQEQPNARRTHHQALVDHVHDLLQALGRSLAESNDAAARQHCAPASTHGEQRWEAGWSLPEVVRDYQILRLVILEYLEEVLDRPPQPRVVMAVGLALDEAIAVSVSRFVKSHDEHIQQLHAERAERDRQIQDHLRQQTEVLREVDRRKNEFLATLGHELRNPLAPLWNTVKLMDLQQPAAPASPQIRDMVRRQVEQLSRLADDLLDIARIARGKVELRKEPVDLAETANRAAQISAPHLKARRQHFELALPAELIHLLADATRLVQIIVNLLNNASKYTDAGGRVWLTVEREDEEAAIRVRDTGMGIAPELMPHVFELFTQGKLSSDRSPGGVGIGLALVRQLVELHGGKIVAHSAGVGSGSEFVVRLPIAMADANNDKPFAAAPKTTGPLGELPPQRILVVDDNVDSAETLSMLLALGGHAVRVAHDGPTALQSAADFRPEVVLLDLGLPRMDGYEVARRLLQQPDAGKMLLVALTGYGQDEDRRRSEEAGFNAHLVKPVELDALRNLLAQNGSHARGPSSHNPSSVTT
jgi:signal transduction histidine kinase/CheY-like chemotaxis protein